MTNYILNDEQQAYFEDMLGPDIKTVEQAVDASLDFTDQLIKKNDEYRKLFLEARKAVAVYVSSVDHHQRSIEEEQDLKEAKELLNLTADIKIS